MKTAVKVPDTVAQAGKIVRLTYIGEKFYWDSKTMMSSLYEMDGWVNKMIRWDWGFVSIALQQGKVVLIEPATEAELAMAKEALKKYRKE